ncbi:uncharacterized protein LOC105431518 [Pogonomyrmex barbatus]|uniref:Uncharacterized protein LOC105431518 n=1 Tax=Pogonomyrmex barbatus TaxID=144034 RepID=A0A6I9WLC5_9HYME|nr:uncharacterized protein LOC105431518 [Pogonomyrmex barbatus]
METEDQIDFWFEHYSKENDNEMKCKYCNKIYKQKEITSHMKLHLREHGIFIYDEKFWIRCKNKFNLIWQYYSRKSNYNAKCKSCGELIAHAYIVAHLENHLFSKHSEEVTKIQKTITDAWLSQYFKFNGKDCMTKCVHCKRKMSIFIGIDELANHLQIYHNISENSKNDERSENGSEVNTVLSKKRHWAWKYYVLDKNVTKCKCCNKVYKSKEITISMKEHLYRVHEIFTGDDWEKFETHTYVVWRYYSKEKGYNAKCRLCDKLLKHAYNMTNLERHLIRFHNETIKKIQKTIKCTWLSQYFKFNAHNVKCICCINCKHKLQFCKPKLTLFHGINGLAKHLQIFHAINENMEPNEGNEENEEIDANVMTQQLTNKNNEKDNAIENEETQPRFSYEETQNAEIVNISKQTDLQTENVSNNFASDVSTFHDKHEYLGTNEGVQESTVNILAQQSIDEENNTCTIFYQVGTHSEAVENEKNQESYYNAVPHQQTITVDTSNKTFQTDTLNNDISVTDTLVPHHINVYLKTNEETGENITQVQQSIDEENNPNININNTYQMGTHLQTMESENNQGSYYNVIPYQQIMTLNISNQILQTDNTPSNDVSFTNALATHNINKCLGTNEEAGENIIGVQIQQSIDEENNTNTNSYQVSTQIAKSEENQRSYYETVPHQQTMTLNTFNETLQNDNTSNNEISVTDTLVFYSTNEYTKTDKEIKENTMDIQMQQSVNKENNASTDTYEVNSHSQTTENEGSQWLYYNAVPYQQAVILDTSNQTLQTNENAENADIRIQQSIDEKNNASINTYQVGLHAQTAESKGGEW